MRTDLERRLADLERTDNGGALRICFIDTGETEAAAVARHWPQGAPERSNILFVGWCGEQMAGAEP